tara:strand:+ start:138 stop:884 length:747 start_codon:yes stop_codon:yes gene_type:complete
MAKRTVRCSYCGGVGHNISTCEKYKEAAVHNVKLLQEKISKETGFVSEQQIAYWKSSLALWKERAGLDKKKRKGTRKCGYCGERGHNRKTCEVKKQDIVKQAHTIQRFRNYLMPKLQEAGFGPGALVCTKSYGSRQDEMYILQDIRWDSIDTSSAFGDRSYGADRSVLVLADVQTLRSYHYCIPGYLTNWNDLDTKYYDGQWDLQMVTPASDVSCPEHFLSYEACLETAEKSEMFKETRPAKFWNDNI